MKDEKVEPLVTLAIGDIEPLGDIGYLASLEDGTRVFLKDRDGVGNEAVAYRLFRALGCDLVPPTGN